MADVPRVTADGRVLSERSAGFPLPKRGLMSTLGSGAQGAAAGLLGMPVDMMSMLTNPILRMIGQNPGTPVGGTESIGSLLGADVQSLPFTVGSMLPFSPGDAMMGAAPFVARAAGKLDMSDAARMERAREMGFDVDRPVFHGSPDLRGVREGFSERTINVSNRATGEFEQVPQATYVTPDSAIARSYADPHRAFDFQNAEEGVLPLMVRGDGLLEINAGGKRFRDIPVENVRRQIPAQQQELFDDLVSKYADPMQLENKGTIGTGTLEVLASKMGYPGFRVKNVKDAYDGKGNPTEIVAVYDPSRLRSTNAAFDPAQSNSSNLLAGVAGAGIGTAMLAPQGAEAQQKPPADMETLLRILRELGIQ